jgi:PIN domain nuclease of toxin-antitoxin system
MSVELLLDTHALLSWLADDPQLSADARTAIADPDSVVAVSAASAWEIAIKSAAGKLRAPAELEQQLRGGSASSRCRSGSHTLSARARCRRTTPTRSTACSSPRQSSKGSRSSPATPR